MLSKINRLPSQEISAILRRGNRVRGEGIEFIYKNTTTIPRFAVIVSTRIDKRAVVRNRMKRLVREALQHMLPTMKQAMDGVIVARHKLPDNEIEVEKLIRTLVK